MTLQLGSIIEYKKHDSDVIELGIVMSLVTKDQEIINIIDFEKGFTMIILNNGRQGWRAAGVFIRVIANNMKEYLATKQETW